MPGRHRAARRVDVEVRCPCRGSRSRGTAAARRQVGRLVVDRADQEDHALLQQARVDVVRALAAAALLDDHRDEAQASRFFHFRLVVCCQAFIVVAIETADAMSATGGIVLAVITRRRSRRAPGAEFRNRLSMYAMVRPRAAKGHSSLRLRQASTAGTCVVPISSANGVGLSTTRARRSGSRSRTPSGSGRRPVARSRPGSPAVRAPRTRSQYSDPPRPPSATMPAPTTAASSTTSQLRTRLISCPRRGT